VPAGKATIRFEFTTDGGKLGAGGTGSIFVNGAKVATGRIENTNGLMFSADEGADVGVDDGTPVTEDYKAGLDSRFTGTIDQVTIDLKPIGPNIKDKVDSATQQLMIDKAAED
jgi:arylsulfatase